MTKLIFIKLSKTFREKKPVTDLVFSLSNGQDINVECIFRCIGDDKTRNKCQYQISLFWFLLLSQFKKKRGQAISFFSIVTKPKRKTRRLVFGFQSPADATKETCFLTPFLVNLVNRAKVQTVRYLEQICKICSCLHSI